jgi:hypothetical protein
VGPAHYVAIDRKPENGIDIKTLCDGHGYCLLLVELNKGKNGCNLPYEKD